jgi:hypothetical protein
MKKWPIIRHVRYFWLKFKFMVWWDKIGSRIFIVPARRDLEYLEKVWRGTH